MSPIVEITLEHTTWVGKNHPRLIIEKQMKLISSRIQCEENRARASEGNNPLQHGKGHHTTPTSSTLRCKYP